MKGQLHIDEMFAFIVLDDDGTEGIPAIPGPGGVALPMVGADMARIESLRPFAENAARRMGKTVSLVKFTNRVHLEDIE